MISNDYLCYPTLSTNPHVVCQLIINMIRG